MTAKEAREAQEANALLLEELRKTRQDVLKYRRAMVFLWLPLAVVVAVVFTAIYNYASISAFRDELEADDIAICESVNENTNRIRRVLELTFDADGVRTERENQFLELVAPALDELDCDNPSNGRHE